MTLEEIDWFDGLSFGNYIKKLNKSPDRIIKEVIPPRFKNHRRRIKPKRQPLYYSPNRGEEPKERRI